MKPEPKGPAASLVAALAIATAECTAVMNEQFIALMADDPNFTRFDVPIAEAILKRKMVMDALLEHIKVYGW